MVSDAVLEHVQDLDSFLDAAHSLLEPRRGAFYAGFGPLWYAPGGDHHDWGPGHEYDHLLLDADTYARRWRDYAATNPEEGYSTEGLFMFEKRLFNYLRPREYLARFRRRFEIDALWVGIHSRALDMARSGDPAFAELVKTHDPLDLAVKAMFVFMRPRPDGPSA
jgi:hypothetical protein